MVQINLSNNLLNKNDEAYILEQLGICDNDHNVNLMEKYDMCYQNSINKFKTEHLTEENRNNREDF